MTCNINDFVEYAVEPNVERVGKITEVSSDMDSYENMELKDGIPLYYSKKLKRYVPVKDKNMDTVFLGVTSRDGKRTDFIYFDEILRCFTEEEEE
jgi:hypothetical protein